MLDTGTKKRIDDCRDILVGKLPDPKAQIEQITIGLIYKFMDDMDKEAVELGGKSKFFSGNYKKYSWDSLFDTKVTASEMLTLYSDAITSMDKNPNIPSLFRDIFKNAFLPYRDPETLKLFLKTIGEFEYTHSEKLGDAFEYLLSVMGSQGDAGQFRTPRHIIDFLVAVVNPDKTDKILDPACGTAGFLISAFKHIKEKNTKGLTPDERKKLIQNFVGYDISPDMVRLSLVNLYLHGFSDPHIWEYDTLSSEERWDETFDVILANPPFMSPKGGIRPHKKFSISSNRSEVLFVDYIVEHLNPKGRAGIIVPEGVIFQSSNAYKDLRKMLVDKYLYAVVSLPAGIFNPYSGVKTSILLLDKELAKKNKEILFVKIDNDGYGLGAQRNAVKGGQLDEAIELLHSFKEGNFTDNKTAHIVSKKEIAKNDDYNLSGEKYKTINVYSSVYKIVSIGNLIEFVRGVTYSKNDEVNTDGIVILRANNIDLAAGKLNFNDLRRIKDSAKVHEKQRLRKDDILICTASGSQDHIGKVAIAEADTNFYFGGFMAVIRANENVVNPKYIFYILKTNFFRQYIINSTVGANIRNLNYSLIENFQIPLPPLSIQEEIVSEIESYQKIIDGANAVIENYKPKIDIDPDWEMVELGTFVKYSQTGIVKNKSEQNNENAFNYIKMDGITYNGQLSLKNIVKVNATKDEFKKYCLKKHDFIYNTRNAPDLVGKSTVFDSDDDKYLYNNNIMRIRFNKKLNPYYANFILNSDSYKRQIRSFVDGTTSVAALYPKNYFSIKIPVAPIELQSQIVAQIVKEQELVNANKQLIEIFEQKIKDKITKVWGD